jgi:hypothetical protein
VEEQQDHGLASDQGFTFGSPCGEESWQRQAAESQAADAQERPTVPATVTVVNA